MGKYVSYKWDIYKYNRDDDGECVFDYKSDFGGLEGRVWDLDYFDVHIKEGDVCGFNIYFFAEDCGNDCADEPRTVYMFTFIDEFLRDKEPRKDDFANFFSVLANIIWCQFWLPLGYIGAFFGDFQLYFDIIWDNYLALMPTDVRSHLKWVEY